MQRDEGIISNTSGEPVTGAITRPGRSEFSPLAAHSEEALIPGDGGMDLASHFSLSAILRRKWTIIGLFILVAGTAIPGVWLMTIPKYRATAMVRVAPVVPRLLYKTEDNGLLPLYTSFLSTQIQIVRSPSVLEPVLDDPEVQKTDWYRNPRPGLLKQPLPPLQRLRLDLSVSNQRGTELINVAIDTDEPADAKLIVDKVVQRYVYHTDTSEEKVDQLKLDMLTAEQSELKTEIDGKIRTRQVLEKKLGTSKPDEIRSREAQRLLELRQELANLDIERELNQWRLDRLENPVAPSADGTEGSAEEAAARSRYEDDSIWRDRYNAAEESRHGAEVAKEHFGDGHPTMKKWQADVAHAEKMLAKREAELDDPRFAPIPVNSEASSEIRVYDKPSLTRAIAEADFRRGQLGTAMEGQKTQVDDVNQKAQTVEQLNLEITKLQTDLNEVTARLNVLRLEGTAAKQIGRVTVSAHAVLPAEPYRDRRILLTLMSLCGAVVLGVGTALLRVALDPSVRESRDVRSALRIPLLGQLPRLRDAAALNEKPSGHMNECMRMIRTALLDRVPNGKGCSIVVTSAGPEAGKTSVSLLLAKSLSDLGRKVLLVDADIRHPGLSRRLGVETREGLTDLLAGGNGDVQSMMTTTDDGVDLLPAGHDASDRDPELMADGAFNRCLSAWKSRYDFIVFDAPPVLPVADARILSGKVDGTILTVRASHCRRSEAAEAVSLVSAAGGHTVGAVLVGAEETLPQKGAYNRYYG
ncbi:MAG: AAA family ATPase [Phycisphaerales bacterium]|nr:AAA family ATPase [Phycisphaerales bacterium]